ncbi:uncharacterized protein C8Q71DRAFT_852286 [Rhodofomes roseus]|uniref:Short-chain dehydrogenase n=1 Tax=Rhodofomes roseus TaxID=34475 RepID=A0ABQ8KX10_9APHY|nr:uncharacterized protein C8Q71DRAFT_852286 [Rhodofomes roseus]KAH9843761.1 hypothetical protein C8Q71DRAFT_852286 [Rhodofomes roseus]
MALRKVWLITGASSGLGRLMTELVLRQQYCGRYPPEAETLDDLLPRWSPVELLALK